MLAKLDAQLAGSAPRDSGDSASQAACRYGVRSSARHPSTARGLGRTESGRPCVGCASYVLQGREFDADEQSRWARLGTLEPRNVNLCLTRETETVYV